MTSDEAVFSEANQAAAANWLWLTDVVRIGAALYAGDSAHPMLRVLKQQFADVTAVHRAAPDAEATLRALGDASFDYVALPGILEWWTSGTAELVQLSRRLLRPGGWLCVAGRNPLRLPDASAGRLSRAASGLAGIVSVVRGGSPGDSGPRATGAALRHAGYQQVRSYSVEPAYTLPRLIVPRTRTAAVACERDRWEQHGGNRMRLLLAAAGLHDLLYGGWLLLASR